MTTRTAPAAFFNTLADQAITILTTAADICDERCKAAAAGSRSSTLWMNRRERVIREIEGRGWRVFRFPGGVYMAEPRG